MPNRAIQYTYDTTQGVQRSSNKDGILIHSRGNDYCVFAVLDGVSSEPQAKFGVNIAIRCFRRYADEFVTHNGIDLSGLVTKANEAILASRYKGPYTTCSIVAIPYDKAKSVQILSVGDTRVYAITKQYIEQLTIDDSESGHIVTKYLGKDGLVLNSTIEYMSAEDQYQILIATDGFYPMFEKNLVMFHKIFNFSLLRNVQRRLRKIVRGNNSDDASYVLVRVGYVQD